MAIAHEVIDRYNEKQLATVNRYSNREKVLSDVEIRTRTLFREKESTVRELHNVGKRETKRGR